MKKGLLVLSLLLTQWLVAAAQQLLPYPIDTIQGKAVYRYEVEKSIGLYRISVNFGVSQEEIIKWNPELKERGLHYGEIIYIPVVNKVEPPKRFTAEPVEQEEQQPVETNKFKRRKTTETQAVESLPTAEYTVTLSDTLPNDSTHKNLVDTSAVRIALMLPFQAQNTKRNQNMDRFVDFYEGVLLALHDMQAEGNAFVLDVYDTEKSEARVRQLINEGYLDSVNAVLGLAYPLQLMQVGEWAKEKHVPVLSPFIDHIEGIENNPYILQFNPSCDQEARTMAEWLEQHKDSINCVLVDAKDADIPQCIRLLRREIAARGIPHTTTSIRDILNDSLSLALRGGKENILIFNTEKYSNIQVLMPRVQNQQTNYRITLYGKYSWSKENVPLPQIYTSVFVRNISNTESYEDNFRHYFGHEHSTDVPRFDLLGYDLAHELVAHLRGGEYHGLQSDVHFERIVEDGGMINTHIEIQRFNP